jgi:hypothetical protein
MPSTVSLCRIPAVEPGLEYVVCSESASFQVEFELKECYSVTMFAAATAHRSVSPISLDNEAIYWYAPVIATGCVLL